MGDQEPQQTTQLNRTLRRSICHGHIHSIRPAIHFQEVLPPQPAAVAKSTGSADHGPQQASLVDARRRGAVRPLASRKSTIHPELSMLNTFALGNWPRSVPCGPLRPTVHPRCHLPLWQFCALACLVDDVHTVYGGGRDILPCSPLSSPACGAETQQSPWPGCVALRAACCCV